MEGNADREQAKEVYTSLAALPVGEDWIWAPDHALLKRVKFPSIHTLDTSKTPKAGDKRIAAPVLASADLAEIAKQIKAIQAAQQDGKAERPVNQKRQAKASPVPAKKKSKPANVRKPVRKPSSVGAAILAARTAPSGRRS